MSNKNTLSLLASIAGLSLIKRKTTGSSALRPDKYVDIDFYFVGQCSVFIGESSFKRKKEIRESFIKQMDTSIFDILLSASQRWRYRGYNKLSLMHPTPSGEAYEAFQIVDNQFEFPAIFHILDYWVWEFEDQYEPLENMEETDAFGGYDDDSLFATLESLSTIFISFDSYKLEIDEDILEPEHEDHFANGYFIQYVPFKLKCRFLLNQNPNDITEAMVYFLTQVVRVGFSDDIDAELDVDVGYKQVIDPNNKLSEFSKSLIFGKRSELRRF